MIPGDLLSAFPHRQFHTLPGLLDSWAALRNSNPNACVPMQGGSLYHFYDGLWYDPAERRTHDLPCERRTRYRLSQPDTVALFRGVYLWTLLQAGPHCNRARKSRVCFAWRYEIHGIITSLGTVRAQPRFRSHVKSMGDFSLLQITVL